MPKLKINKENTFRNQGIWKSSYRQLFLALTSLSNWERGASPPQSMPPPDESEPSEGDVI